MPDFGDSATIDEPAWTLVECISNHLWRDRFRLFRQAYFFWRPYFFWRTCFDWLPDFLSCRRRRCWRRRRSSRFPFGHEFYPGTFTLPGKLDSLFPGNRIAAIIEESGFRTAGEEPGSTFGIEIGSDHRIRILGMNPLDDGIEECATSSLSLPDYGDVHDVCAFGSHSDIGTVTFGKHEPADATFGCGRWHRLFEDLELQGLDRIESDSTVLIDLIDRFRQFSPALPSSHAPSDDVTTDRADDVERSHTRSEQERLRIDCPLTICRIEILDVIGCA